MVSIIILLLVNKNKKISSAIALKCSSAGKNPKYSDGIKHIHVYVFICAWPNHKQ